MRTINTSRETLPKMLVRPLESAARMHGFTLATTLLILAIVTALSMNALGTAFMEEKMSSNQKLMAKAHLAAELGVSSAIDDLLSGTISDSGMETDPAWNASGVAEGNDYAVNYTIRHRLLNGAVASDKSGVPFYVINAVGSSSGASGNITTTVALKYRSAWETGIVGCDSVRLKGEASTGSYSFMGIPNANGKGDIRTTNADGTIKLDGNVTVDGSLYSAGDVMLDGNAKILGDVHADGAISLLHNASIHSDAFAGKAINDPFDGIKGTSHQNQLPEIVPPEVCDPFRIDELFVAEAHPIRRTNDNGELTTLYRNGDDYSINGNNPDIIGIDGKSRKFHFDNFTIDANATVEIRGDATLYIEDKLSLHGHSQLTLAPGASLIIYISGTMRIDSNSTINGGGNPANLKIYSNAANGSGSERNAAMVQSNANSSFFATIYAPKALIVLNSNKESRGAIRGRWIDIDSGSIFWYDGDLADRLSPNPIGYELVDWTE